MRSKSAWEKGKDRRHLVRIVASLGAAGFACRPIITVGWAEILILAGIIVFAISPFLLKVYRAYLGVEDEPPDGE